MKILTLMKSIQKIGDRIEATKYLALGTMTLLVFSSLPSVASANPSSWSNSSEWGSSSNSGRSYQDHSSRRSRRKKDNSVPFTPGSNNVAIELGQVFLMGNLGDDFEDSIGFRAHYTYGVSDIFGFDASAGYSSHSEGSYSVATLLTGLRTNLAWYDRVVPFATFGLGFYRPSYELESTKSISQLLFGLHLGPGVELLLTQNLYFGASLTFHDVFGKKKIVDGETVNMGGTFTSFLVHAGMTF